MPNDKPKFGAAEYAEFERQRKLQEAKERYVKHRDKDPDLYRAKQKAVMARWRKNNPEATKAMDQRQKEKHKDKRREKGYVKKYGITIAQFDELFLSQGSRCAICWCDEPGKNGWQVDHCHTNGNVRGILCHRCNMALGLLKDNPNMLRIAVGYLERALE